MRKTPLNETYRSKDSSFSPPAFPPKGGMVGHLVHFSRKATLGVGRCVYGFTEMILSLTVVLAVALAISGVILLPLAVLVGFEDDYNYEPSNRNIALENSRFVLEDENRTEISSADLLPGDRITFIHEGNITEIVHSYTSCSSYSSGISDWGESDSDSYYGGEDEMECWTNYFTHYVLNASSFMFESSSVNDIYMCHRSTCKVTGELIDRYDFWIDIRSVEVIS
jgi:hypothetical protein